MGQVIPLGKKPKDEQEEVKSENPTDTDEYFKHVAEVNKRRREKQLADRVNANKSVTRNYNLKPR